MNRLEHGEVTVAIVATPTSPVGETGGGEVFTGALANVLAEQGFPVRVYGQENPNFTFVEGVTHVGTGPATNTLISRDGVGLRKAINETGIAAPLQLGMDIESSQSQRWVIIDNDTTSAPLTPFMSGRRIPHIFIQHSHMTPNTYRIYENVRAWGGKIVAIADHQREGVIANFGELHATTIKNGVDTRSFDGVLPRPRERGEPIHVGTLSRIEPSDSKGVQLTVRVVEKLRNWHDTFLTIAGPVDQATYDGLVAPSLSEHVTYVGPKKGKDKAAYLADVHVGAALSNPGGWDDGTNRFTSRFIEGNSLTLHEMMYSGVIPVSSDSGGAEPLRDAGLSDFIVPLSMIPAQGIDAFTDLAAQTMLKAAHHLIELPDLRRKARTMDDVGSDYAAYIMSLLRKQPVLL